MKLGLKKNAARDTALAVDLFAQCGQLYAAHRELARDGRDQCCDYILNLAAPDRKSACEMTVYDYPERSYGLFPAGKYAGHGSFIDPDGGFRRHGRITAADAARILATYTPAASR